MLAAIVGINWGDEGKGRMVDLLSESYDIVVRYQGGNNAGHTVINDKGTFVFNLLPSGILRDDVVNVMGPGVVIDLEHLYFEVEKLRAAGIAITPENLKISDKATICMPYHSLQERLEYKRAGVSKFGASKLGITAAYSDKYSKKTLRMGDLFHPEHLLEKLEPIVEWKNLLIHNGYGADAIDPEEIYDWIVKYGLPFKDYICDTTAYLTPAAYQSKNILFETQFGAMRDVDFGVYPYAASSSTISSYAPIGAGIPAIHLDTVIGVMKAYSSCVGDGPFVAEMTGEDAEKLRKAGNEVGVDPTNMKQVRVGGFDIPASKYGIMIQGADKIALTKLDVLSCYEKIPVCVKYEIDGVITDKFPRVDRLDEAKPIYEYLEGWSCDISGCRSYDELPRAAKNYIEFIENSTGCVIRYVSVGAGRDQYLKKD